ncbi:MAG TPA: GNAT family protein [Pyrinomonadaceae bacterium]|nr:GNAT family protein [Pyrinomonadaceae bacterium]
MTKELLPLRLVAARAEHAAAWMRWRNEAASRRFNPLLPLTVEELARRLSSYYGSDLADRARAEYRWMVQFGDEVVGTVSASNVSWAMGYIEIGYMLAESHQGQGLGTRAVRLLVDKLFRETDLHRIFATVSVENEPSCRLLARLGFAREGTLREHYLIQGRRIDEAVYGLLRHEWKRNRDE